jgi:hypothetical protein
VASFDLILPHHVGVFREASISADHVRRFDE